MDDAFQDNFVCRLGNGAHEKHLLSQCQLTFDKAIMFARSMEVAKVGAKWYHSGDSLHVGCVECKLSKPDTRSQCYYCGDTRHKGDKCRC